ncbi:TIGR03013 family XrtA/PEP-CTERM system glycosyltransferase [Eilatimonas milleporae]|uniref:Sugar transferase (PEP-CTERM system associated)/exopolysaccharide biosynthesis polyprenyl glycosylphosphotransferase n=1 Tax=Eilatimonas milleporae TaxID=911205 RepID=A0A3M0CJH0_9PROT|nr:TIGR03013 family XrtA/PEP-CTERM system glycosyltransferase [Eilatimonas milleporae]RMB08927.1 sugar transferase (PEP-CTERM system associated)/exopolysaccharide biosynthesis polyprenyl glycosylphosphotransferase [Eilatimonas milleporae]
MRIFRHHISPIKLVLITGDFLLLLLASWAAGWLRYRGLGLAVDPMSASLATSIVFAVLISMCMLAFGAYQIDAIRDFRVLLLRVAVALCAGMMLVSAVLYFIPTIALWRSVLVIAIVLSGIAVSFWHAFLIFLIWPTQLATRLVIVGDPASVSLARDVIAKAGDAGLEPVGAVDPGRLKETGGADAAGPPLMPDLLSFARARDAEMILIADNTIFDSLPISQFLRVKMQGLKLVDMASFIERTQGCLDLKAVAPFWLAVSGFSAPSPLEKTGKRVFDIATALTLLLVTAPFALVTAFAVRITSPGPVLYKQTRVGLDGQDFELLKFRSMREDAEASGGPQWAQKNDPRITPVGRFIRRTRLDEIPQIINVLKGDMSIVGPRPERPFFVEELARALPLYPERHLVKPGITGWAQLRYSYGASAEDARRKLEYDLYYIKNYSLFLDFLIVLQTIRVVIFPQGVR